MGASFCHVKWRKRRLKSTWHSRHHLQVYSSFAHPSLSLSRFCFFINPSFGSFPPFWVYMLLHSSVIKYNDFEQLIIIIIIIIIFLKNLILSYVIIRCGYITNNSRTVCYNFSLGDFIAHFSTSYVIFGSINCLWTNCSSKLIWPHYKFWSSLFW